MSRVPCMIVGLLLVASASTLSAADPPVKPGQVRTNSIGMKLVEIPAGEFLMGSPDSEAGREKDEGPQHRGDITESCG